MWLVSFVDLAQNRKMLHLKVKRELNDFPRDNLNDFLMLEEYFDRNIKLRLNGANGEDELKEAHDISTIITSNTILKDYI